MNATPLPFRLSADGQTATWNPGLARATQVVLHVKTPGGDVEHRRTMNSGRARVRAGERIQGIVALDEASPAPDQRGVDARGNVS
jgi:hypothetical protein